MGIHFMRKKGFIRNNTIKGKIIIGIIGTHIGAGATHFSILLSNYMSECLGNKTAYVECFPQNEIQYIEKVYDLDSNATSDNKYFSLYKVDYYKCVKERQIAEIQGYDYDCLVLDLGLDIKNKKNEFIRCDKKIVVSNVASWKHNELINFLVKDHDLLGNQNIDFAITFSSNKLVKDISKQYKIPMFCVPYEPDPSSISIDTIKMFQRII